MKIALVFESLGIGGIERTGVDYAHIFQELGHEVELYNLTPNANEMEPRFPDQCRISAAVSDYAGPAVPLPADDGPAAAL